jgi:hypothetical protein
VPGALVTVTDENGVETEVPGEPIEIPGTLGGGGGFGGDGGAGGNAGSIRFTSIVDDTAPVLEAAGGAGGAGGPGGLTGQHGAFAEVPPDTPTAAADGTPGAFGAEGTITVATLSEEDYIAGLRPLLDAEGPSYANHWAPYRKAVGQFFYRQFRKSQPLMGQLAATEFDRCLELQADNVEAQQWRHQLLDFPRPVADGPGIEWVPGGLNALGLRRDLDVLPQFEAFSRAFTSFSTIVLDFLFAGQNAILNEPELTAWQGFLARQRQQAVDAQKSMQEDRELAETEVRLASQELAAAQSRLDQTTRDIQAALAAMRQEETSIFGVIGTIAGIAGAVVAVAAAVPSAGASLVTLVPSMVALTGAVIDDLEPIGKAMLAGDLVNTEKVKSEYDKVDKQAAAVVKGAKAIADFVKIVQALDKVTPPDNSNHLALVRQGVQQTYDLLVARNNSTLAEQRRDVAGARVARTADAIAGIDALANSLVKTEEALRQTGLDAIAVAEARADALLTLAFYAQRSMEIYTLTDREDMVRLESGHLHPDQSRAYAEREAGELADIQLAQQLTDSWQGLLGMLDLQVAFSGFLAQPHDRDERRLSFRGAELQALRTTRRFSFRIDPASLPPGESDAKVQGVRLSLIGATAPTSEVTCVIGRGSAYETRRPGGAIDVTVLQPRASHRDAKLGPLVADEGLAPDPLLTDPQSLAFWGRGMGGEWELSIPDDQFDAGLDLTALTEVQVWINYQHQPDAPQG